MAGESIVVFCYKFDNDISSLLVELLVSFSTEGNNLSFCHPFVHSDSHDLLLLPVAPSMATVALLLILFASCLAVRAGNGHHHMARLHLPVSDADSRAHTAHLLLPKASSAVAFYAKTSPVKGELLLNTVVHFVETHFQRVN